MSAPPLPIPRLLILANHQHGGLATAIRALLPAARIFSADLALLARDDAARAAAIAAIAASDHIITQNVAAGLGPLSTAALRAGPRPVHLLPRFQFAGFHPDGIAITLDGTRLAGPTGATHSRIAATAYLAGFGPEETAGLYNSLVFARLGYFAAFATERARLMRHFAAYGYDIAPFFEAWLRPGCFTFAATHPRMRVLLDIARLLCARMGIDPATDAAAEHELPNPLASYPTHPLFPEIAGRIGVSPEGSFRGQTTVGAKPTLYSLDAFIRASFAAYRQMPLAILRGAGGVRAALQALNLPEADFGRAAAAARAAVAPAQEAVFLTWRGNLLGSEIATRLLVQTPPWPQDTDSTPAAVRMALPVTAPIGTTLAGGTDIAPGPIPGTVTLARQGRLLSAPPGLLSPSFTADTAAEAEIFLPMPRGTLAVLRKLAAANWTAREAGPLISGAAIRLYPGFVLALGPHRIDLLTVQFEQTEHPGRIAISAGPHTITLTQSPGVPADEIPIDMGAEPAMLPPAASLEQFRFLLGHALPTQGHSEMIHLPLTVDNATRAWLYDSCAKGAMPRLGPALFHATPTHAADKFVLLSRGAEGVIFDEGGIEANAGFLNGATLPPGVRIEHGTLLLDRAEAAAAPKIAGPVCVFYTPDLDNSAHWLMEAAVALHVLAPILPIGTRLLLPPGLEALGKSGGFDHLAMLAALGFGGIPTAMAEGPLVRAADIIWLAHGGAGAMPAALVQSFRAQVHTLRPPTPPASRLYLKYRHGPGVAANDALDKILQAREFEPVHPEDFSITQQIDLFASAAFLVAPHGAPLANLVFCQPGTRVLELSPEAGFSPLFWLLSEKLGLFHAVLACKMNEGELMVDADRFRALFQMLRFMEA